MDFRFLAAGVAMIVIAVVLSLFYSNVIFTGPLEEFNQSRGILQLVGIVGGIGVLLMLASFGLGRRKRRMGRGRGKGMPPPVKPDKPT